MSDTVKTVVLGVSGLLVAIALSIAALQLTNQQVGITAEPVNAGRELAPTVPNATGDEGAYGGGNGAASRDTVDRATPAPTTGSPAGDDQIAGGDSDVRDKENPDEHDGEGEDGEDDDD